MVDVTKRQEDIGSRSEAAFIAIAVGDALGWPNEDRARRRGSLSPSTFSFQQWIRRAGGRFYAHEETILPGEYSDDTQLTLCTARSVGAGAAWWNVFALRELPTWLLYERGGGGATKRAAEQWSLGGPPWWARGEEDRRRYFAAGGNGVAMRILPHAIFGSQGSFDGVAERIISNGICTHGQPRALLGALLYGFAVWDALQPRTTLEYGYLLEHALTALEEWSTLPRFDFREEWISAATSVSGNTSFDDLWARTVAETRELLETCRNAMKQGALAIDREVLQSIGGFDRHVSGAGTVTAAGALFLASRYAADPRHGMLEAATSLGSDTDTLASMTAGLLGAAVGEHWLQDYTNNVQDSAYLRRMARSVAAHEVGNQEAVPDRAISKDETQDVVRRLEKSKEGDKVRLTDGRFARVEGKQLHLQRSGQQIAMSWRLVTSDGQSIYIKRFLPKSRRPEQPPGRVLQGSKSQGELGTQLDLETKARQKSAVTKVVVRLLVSKLDASRHFYADLLELPITKAMPNGVKIGDALHLQQQQPPSSAVSHGPTATAVCIEMGDLEPVRKRILDAGLEATMTRMGNGRRVLRCFDPDLNSVEIFESISD